MSAEASSAHPAAALTLDDIPRRPWTSSRILYATLLWLVWGAGMVWHTQLVWLDRFMPLHMSVSVQAATHLNPYALVYWVSAALLVVIPVRLFFDNLRMNLLPIFLGAVWALMACVTSSENVPVLDQLAGEVAFTRQVVVRERVTTPRGGYRGPSTSLTEIMVDHPLERGKRIGFPESWAQGLVGDTLCMDVLVGQSGAMWALLPKPCPGKAVR